MDFARDCEDTEQLRKCQEKGKAEKGRQQT